MTVSSSLIRKRVPCIPGSNPTPPAPGGSGMRSATRWLPLTVSSVRNIRSESLVMLSTSATSIPISVKMTRSTPEVKRSTAGSPVVSKISSVVSITGPAASSSW